MTIKKETCISLCGAKIIYNRVQSSGFTHGYETKECKLFSDYYGVKYSTLMRYVGYLKLIYLENING